MKRIRHLISLLALAALAHAASARNVAIVHPIAPVVAGKAGQDLVSSLRWAFGGATSSSGTLLAAGFEVEGIGNSDYTGNRRPTDAEVCNRALLDALSKLAIAARKAGANGVVGIVSNYEHRLFDDPTHVECHAGTFKAHVVLKANFVQLDTAPTGAASAVEPSRSH